MLVVKCNWLICIMQVPFLSLLTRTASSTNSAAQYMETLYTRANTAATSHKVSTWNMACATEELNFKLCLILINLSLNEKKPYVAIDYHCGQCRSMIRMEWPSSAALQNVRTPGKTLHVSIRGLWWDGWHPSRPPGSAPDSLFHQGHLLPSGHWQAPSSL